MTKPGTNPGTTNPEHEWLEVIVPVKVALADGVANELVQEVGAAQNGVEVRKGSVVFWVDPLGIEATLVETRACLRRLASEGWDVDADRLRPGDLAPEEDWRDAWKKFFHTTRLTRQIVVVPSWESYEPSAADITIDLDPGQAFGTGSHASTQLVLETLQELIDAKQLRTPARVFDLGTGSGILAIAAAKFWPRTQIVATDIDPLAMKATRENAENNHVAARIEASTTDLTAVKQDFPLVLANLQAHILRDLRDDLLPRVLRGGTLLLSGILSTQIRPLVDFYCETEVMELVGIRQSQLNTEWSSAHLRRVP